MTQAALITETTKATKVCRKCDVEKPLTEFYVVNGRWHLNVCKSCTLEKMKEYHQRTWPDRYARYQEVRKQRTKKYYRDTLKPRNLELYGKATSPEEVEYRRKVRASNKKTTGYGKTESQRAQGRQHYRLLRTRMIALYGGVCECCGEARYDMLTVDHKTREPRATRKRGVALTYDALREYESAGYPNNRYRLLCWNCNSSIGHYGYCPHEADHQEYEHASSALKLDTIVAYGGRCTICDETRWEFLTIDHVNGGGSQHRASVSGNLYSWLMRQGWPKNGYRLLCANCNCSMKTNGWNRGQVRESVTYEKVV